ncbi:class I SAM-dependent methyltransferase [Aestuariivivens insulae]|uniref:class I SAM-dependent methyltransferase n=1 Tax=Aestuariivivens insulae TaxID=1621988 RepID=UPI001F5739D5|nr:class I SAM-dependent methyltransferase [Aestuariivivens insulae]
MSEHYYKTKASVEEYIKLAKDVNGSQLIAKLNNYLLPGASLLEIGSGPGTDFQILRQDYSVVGSDYSTEFLKRLMQNNPKAEFLNLDAITLETDKKFDGIYSNKVLQHLTNEDLKRSILRQVDVLHDNGIICHSFWKGEGDEIFKGLLVNYQTNESLRLLFGNYFEILLIEAYNEFEDGDSLVLIGKKK